MLPPPTIFFPFSLIPLCFLPSQDVASKVLAHRDVCIDMEPEVLQSELVNSVRDHPLYGTCFFHVRKHRFPDQMESYPDECIIALNSEGLHFLNEDRETLSSFGYADIYRWGGSSTSFSIIIWNAETQDTDDVSMYTCQAADMASLILDVSGCSGSSSNGDTLMRCGHDYSAVYVDGSLALSRVCAPLSSRSSRPCSTSRRSWNPPMMRKRVCGVCVPRQSVLS